jgi:hypothetical protein
VGCILLAIGLVASVVLLPVFKNLYDSAIVPLTVGINSPILQVIFIAIPYVPIIVIVIAAFLLVRRREV